MYIVSPDGQVADAFPGVYRPENVLPSFRAAAKVAMESAEARDRYHKQRTSRAIQARVNTSKAFIESPMLDAQGVGDQFERFSVARVADLSHVAMPREMVRTLINMPEGLSEQEQLDFAISADSRNNMDILRPMVHDYLIGKRATPSELREVMFKEFLGVKIDDPNLGIK